MPATDFAISEAVKYGDRVSFGLHINICEGYPLTNPRTLTQPNGMFFPKRKVALDAISGRIDLKEVETEFSAQIECAKRNGIQISHIDSHKHLHQLPGVSKVVCGLARRFGIERIRCTLEKGIWPKGHGITAHFYRLIRIYLAKKAGRNFREAGLRYPDRVFDLKELITQKTTSRRLAFIRRIEGISEMFCHPGTTLADMEKPGSCERHRELQFLLSDEFGSLIREAPIELKSFWDC
jgi:predicted glycoside hydrolase/deacetylase ChbG (UPF0249 family)